MNYYTEVRLGSVTSLGKLVNFNEYKRMWIDTECYNSVYLYPESALKHWETYRSCKGYDGPMSFNYLYIDIDFEDLTKAQVHSQTLVNELKSRFKLMNEQISVFFSGGKGFHIGLSSKLFDAYRYTDVNVPLIAKAMVADIIKVDPFDTEAQSAAPIDFSVYNRTRIFRTPLSRHKSGAYKIPISVETLFNKDIEHIKSLAESKKFDKIEYVFHSSNSLGKLFKKYKGIKPAWNKISAPSSGRSYAKGVAANKTSTVFKVPAVGGRNDLLHKQAFRLFASQNGSAPLTREEVWAIMEMITDHTNKESGGRPITTTEYNAFMLSSERSARMNNSNKFSVSKFSSIVSQAVETIKHRQAVPLNVDAFDKVLKGGLRLGNLYFVIGVGGTKKSIFMQNKILIPAAIQHELNGMTFNLEMSEEQLVIRGVKMLLKQDLEYMVDQGNLDLSILEQEIEEKLGDRLLTVSDTTDASFTPKLIEQITRQYEKDSGRKIHYIVIDSLGAMDMGSNEIASLIKYAAQLKKVAKTNNWAVIPIHHTNSQAEKHFRDAGQYVRGGVKLLDHADGYLSLSLLLEPDKCNWSTRDYKYQKEFLWVKLVDKRESGDVVDKLFALTKDLRLAELQDDPFKYEFTVPI